MDTDLKVTFLEPDGRPTAPVKLKQWLLKMTLTESVQLVKNRQALNDLSRLVRYHF